MHDPRDIVDIDGLRPAEPAAHPSGGQHAPKPYLMIWFRCCETYGRIPKARDGSCYEGRCPKCLAKLTVPVGDGGTRRRMFEAG